MKWFKALKPKRSGFITAVLTGENSVELTEFVDAQVIEFSFDRVVIRVEWKIERDMTVRGILFATSFNDVYSFKHIHGYRELKRGDIFSFKWTRDIESVHTETF